MTLRNVNYVRAQDLTNTQKEELGIELGEGLVAIETHNEQYKKKPVVVSKGIVNYILNGD